MTYDGSNNFNNNFGYGTLRLPLGCFELRLRIWLPFAVCILACTAFEFSRGYDVTDLWQQSPSPMCDGRCAMADVWCVVLVVLVWTLRRIFLVVECRCVVNSRVGRKGGMVTISFARGKHMQFAVVLVIYDIIYIKHCSCSGLFNSLLWASYPWIPKD